MRVGLLLAVQTVAVTGIVAAGLASAPPASADCVSSGGTTLCSQGDARGSDTGRGPGTMSSYNPYVCGYDGDCDYGWGWDVDVDLSPGRPGHRPGRPGGN